MRYDNPPQPRPVQGSAAQRGGIPFSVFAALFVVAGTSVAAQLIKGQSIFPPKQPQTE